MNWCDIAKQGGPAFPLVDGSGVLDAGMSLRDYFAGQALSLCEDMGPTEASEWAYECADAMLIARQVKP